MYSEHLKLIKEKLFDSQLAKTVQKMIRIKILKPHVHKPCTEE